MNFILKTTTVLIIINITSLSQPVLEWARTYNGPMNQTDIANALAVDDSGYVYVTGILNVNHDPDRCTIKYKPNGDTAWVRIFGSIGTIESGGVILIDSIGNVFIAGAPILQKLDRNGNVIWTKYDSAFGWSYGSGKMHCTRDRNICLMTPFLNQYYIISKYDASTGDRIWRKIYDVGASSQCYDMAIDSNNNIIVVGRKANGPSPPNYHDFYVMKCNSVGDSLWTWRYNGPDPQIPYDFAYAVTVDDTGNIYATGFSDNEIGQSQFFTVKLTPDGDTVWTRRFSIGGSDAWNINLDKQGNIYVSGRTNITQATVVKYSIKGTFQWSRTLPHTMILGYRPYQTLDTTGSVYITATSDNFNGLQLVKYSPSGEQLWFINYNYTEPRDIMIKNTYLCITGGYYGVDMITLKYSQPIGIQPISNEVPKEYKLFQNYPNPFNPETRIRFQIPEFSYVKIIVYDILVKEITVLLNQNLNAGVYETAFNAVNLASGVYFCKMIADNYSETIKLSLIR